MKISEYQTNCHAEAVRLANAKTAIATAIEGKGVTVPEGTKPDGMAPLIESIEASGVGVVTTLHINVTAVNTETMEATFTADRTPSEMQQASVNGPTWCVVSFAAGILSEEAVSLGVPPTWGGGEPAFGGVTAPVHVDSGSNKTAYAVRGGLSDTWILDLSAFGS